MEQVSKPRCGWSGKPAAACTARQRQAGHWADRANGYRTLGRRSSLQVWHGRASTEEHLAGGGGAATKNALSRTAGALGSRATVGHRHSRAQEGRADWRRRRQRHRQSTAHLVGGHFQLVQHEEGIQVAQGARAQRAADAHPCTQASRAGWGTLWWMRWGALSCPHGAGSGAHHLVHIILRHCLASSPARARLSRAAQPASPACIIKQEKEKNTGEKCAPAPSIIFWPLQHVGGTVAQGASVEQHPSILGVKLCLCNCTSGSTGAAHAVPEQQCVHWCSPARASP